MPEWDKEFWPDWNIFVEERCKCAYCGMDGTTDFLIWRNLEIDHIIPWKSCGGTNNRINKTVSCLACNRAKHRFNPANGTDFKEPRDSKHREELIREARNYIFYQRREEEGSFHQMMDEINHRQKEK
jgi:hypothetical protein